MKLQSEGRLRTRIKTEIEAYLTMRLRQPRSNDGWLRKEDEPPPRAAQDPEKN
jgi:hypothetical protein